MDDLEYLELLEELNKRKKHASQTYNPLDNQPQQLAYHKDDAWCRLLFGGNRSGKSRGAAQEIYWFFSESHPYLTTPSAPRIWVLSAEYRTIFEGIWTHLKNVIPPWSIAKVGSKLPNWDIPSYITSKTGARIDFISAQGGEETRKRLQAAEIDLLAIDEEVGGELWIELQARLVTRGGKVIVSATLIESEDWLLDLEEQAKQGSTDVKIFRLDSRKNTFNNAAAMQRFMSNLSAEEQDVRIYGRSRKMSGLVYANWSDLNDIEPFPIPDGWTKAMCLDPGHRTAAALWIAINDRQQAIAYREMYLHNCELIDVANFIQEAEQGERIDFRYCDPAGFKHHDDGSVGVAIQMAQDYGIYFIPASSRNKDQNIEDVRRWLHKDLTGIPGFRIFNTLQNFKLERRKYRFPKDKGNRDRAEPRNLPIKRLDHLMNCWEYLATARIQYNPMRTEQEMIETLALNPNIDISILFNPANADNEEYQRKLAVLVTKKRFKLRSNDYED